MNGLAKLARAPQAPKHLGFFRFREVGGDVLLTNAVGDWAFVSKAEHAAIMAGDLEPGTPLYDRLRAAHFVADPAEVERLVERTRARKRFLDHGPNLHILVVTLRCNQTCVYCHASRADMDAVHTDMSKETADRVVDLVLQSTSPSVTIEFQGGEPLVAFDVVKHVVETAREKNRAVGKELEFTMVSNLSMMDEEKLRFLVDNRVQLCTSVDGPQPIHDKQRKLVVARDEVSACGGSFDVTAKWIARINAEYARIGLDPVLYHVEALLTTTREALAHPREIVDTYVDLGCRAIFLRPVDPFGFAARTGATIEYERDAYLAFYRAALARILEHNRNGVQVLERFAAIFLTKILAGVDPNFLDIRSPCGAGIGQIAYDHDGSIYTCDEGRMVGAMGSSFFRIGAVGESSYRSLVRHPTVRALAMASNLDAQPDCVTCAYNPYCGVCPVHSYQTQGSIFGRMRESSLCMVHKGIQDILFDELRRGDPATLEAFRRWTTIRPRDYFVQPCAAI
jgi:His-Xaa-Ser system radical SAM maturase HxsB